MGAAAPLLSHHPLALGKLVAHHGADFAVSFAVKSIGSSKAAKIGHRLNGMSSGPRQYTVS